MFTAPDTYLASPEGQAFLQRKSRKISYDPFRTINIDSLKSANKIANTILASRQAGASPEDAVIAAYLPSENDNANDDDYVSAIQIAEAHVKMLVDETSISENDRLLFEQSLTETLWDRTAGDYRSTPLDIVSPHDYCEIVFLFGVDPNEHAIDQLIEPAWCIDHATLPLGRALKAIGLSIADFADALKSLNRHSKTFTRRAPRSDPADGDLPTRRRRHPLISKDNLRTLISETFGYHFFLCAYAQVPVRSLVDIDLAAPMTFSKAAISVYNPFDGTFFDVTLASELTVSPTDGSLVVPDRWHSPDDICGLSSRYYRAALTPIPPTNRHVKTRRPIG